MSEQKSAVANGKINQAASELVFILALLALMVIASVMTITGERFTLGMCGLILFSAGVLILRKQRVLLAWTAAVTALKG